MSASCAGTLESELRVCKLLIMMKQILITALLIRVLKASMSPEVIANTSPVGSHQNVRIVSNYKLNFSWELSPEKLMKDMTMIGRKMNMNRSRRQKEQCKILIHQLSLPKMYLMIRYHKPGKVLNMILETLVEEMIIAQMGI